MAPNSIGHLVVHERRRPLIDADTPPEYASLIQVHPLAAFIVIGFAQTIFLL
jgi:hypothetical protein